MSIAQALLFWLEFASQVFGGVLTTINQSKAHVATHPDVTGQAVATPGAPPAPSTTGATK